MSLSAIYSALDGAITDGAIDLYSAAENADLEGLPGVLGLFGITASFTLTGAAVQRSDTAVTLTGTGSWGAPGASQAYTIDATLTATTPNAENQFQLVFQVQSPSWTFSDFFQTLPECHKVDPNGMTISLAPSYLVGLPLGSVEFSGETGTGQSLMLTGALQPVGELAAYQDLFPKWPLQVSGPVTLASDAGTAPPAFELDAIEPGLRIAFYKAQMQGIGLRLAVYNDLDQLSYGVAALSELYLTGRLYFGSNAEPLILSMQLLAVGTTWRLMVQIPDDAFKIGEEFDKVADLFGLNMQDLPTPPGLNVFNDFYLSEIEIWLPKMSKLMGEAPKIDHVAVTLASDKIWNPPIPFVRIAGVGTRWLIGFAGGEPYIAGCVYGSMLIGKDMPPSGGAPIQPPPQPTPPAPAPGTTFTFDVNALIPQFIVSGSLRQGDTIPIGTAFEHFFGKKGPPAEHKGKSLEITAFAMEADPRTKTFMATADITTPWSIPLGENVTLEIAGLSFNIDVSQSSVNGSITGTLVLDDTETPQPQFIVGAAFDKSDGTTGWTFTGALSPRTPLSINTLVSNMLGITPPSGLPPLDIDAMALSFETESKAYDASGTISTCWQPKIFDEQLTISAVASAHISRPDKNTKPSGWIMGQFAVNQVELSAKMDIGVANPTNLYQLKIDELWFDMTTSWTGQAPDQRQIFTVQLGGVTLGSMLEYLVNLVAPTIGYHLDPPWDMLNKISLSRFVLTIDPKMNVIELTYQANVDIGIMRISNIGVRSQKQNGEPAVNLILEGKFLDKTYDNQNPLSWNVISDPPPNVSGGGGNKLFDLSYLALGQHVTLENISTLTTVEDVINAMKLAMLPVKDTTKPPPMGSTLVFDANSEWLIGLDISLLETVALKVVFNDPTLYGLFIALSGERAKALSGLKFEILYKKITNNTGMYRIELRLPQAFRHIQLGEVSITLGVIVVEIYTNGNFLVDLGFPHHHSFQKSFSVEVFPFLGRGGFYFGDLNGATSSRVPMITNGNFSPVLVLGIGIAVGVGKDIQEGPLSGGVYVQVEAIFQGVLGWFNPASSSVKPAEYYWCQGVAAIHGKLYATIDFKIIKVSLNVDAYASASVILEAYQPAIFELIVEVTAEAHIKIIFFTISFSFHVGLDTSFTVGHSHPTPWVLSTGQSHPGLRRIRSNVVPPLRLIPSRRNTALCHEHLLALYQRHKSGMLFDEFSQSDLLNWDTSALSANYPKSVALHILPIFSVTNVPLGWTTPPATPANPDYRIALQVIAENGVPPTTWSIRETLVRSAANSVHAETIAEQPAALLIEAFLRWAIRAATTPSGGTEPNVITAGQMLLLKSQLDLPHTADAIFTIDTLKDFFSNNLSLQIAGDPGGTPTEQGGMFVPMPPFLTMKWSTGSSGGGSTDSSHDFSQYNKVGPLYEHGIAKYMKAFTTIGADPGEARSDNPDSYESFATYVFRDWCLMVTKMAVQAANDLMQTWPLALQTAASLQDIVNNNFQTTTISYVVRMGDTPDSVAQAIGITTEDLEANNPNIVTELSGASAGSSISITLGVSPEMIAIDNPELPLTENTYPLGNFDYQTYSDDTLNGIVTKFSLSDASALVAGGNLAADTQLLQAGASVEIGPSQYAVTDPLTATTIAAIFYAHYYAPTGTPHAEWYAETIAKWNAKKLKEQNHILAVGTQLTLPTALNQTTQPPATNYTTLPGDTLTRIGAALSLAQNFATAGSDQPWPSWGTFRDSVTGSLKDGEVTIPATTMTILPGETLNQLADRTILYPSSNIASFLGVVGTMEILAPHAVLTIAGANVDTTTYNTFSAISRNFGLTISDVGRRLKGASKLIPKGSDLTISHLPVQSIETLVDVVLNGDAVSRISGFSSRQTMSGLRLPAPIHEKSGSGTMVAEGPMTAFYDLTGQQFPGPVTADSLDITISTDDGGVDWITLADSDQVRHGETLSMLLDRFPEARQYNRRLAGIQAGADPILPEGAVVHTQGTKQLQFKYAAGTLSSYYPADPVLTITPSDGPAAMGIAIKVPRTYGLDHRIELQTSASLDIKAVAGTSQVSIPSLWPFSDELKAKAGASTATKYEIIRSSDHRTRQSDHTTVTLATFATLLPFQVRRLESQPHVYELQGVKNQDRQVLLYLWQYLTTPHTAKAYLLLSPPPNAGNTNGLAQVLVNSSLTYLLKTNLSTGTVPGVTQEEAASPTYFADFSSLGDFLKLLWEGSVVGGTGYYFGFTSSTDNDLPGDSFDQQGNATLQLLVVTHDQQDPLSSPDYGRSFQPFNNCALVGDNLDASAHSLYVQAATPDTDMATIAALPPGSIGFTMTMDKPQSEGGGIDHLFSLLTYQVGTSTDIFYNAQPGLPVTPQDDDGSGMTGWQRQQANRRIKAAGGIPPDRLGVNPKWKYSQVLPVSRMGPSSQAPATAGYPNPESDPYRGIGGQSTAQNANISLGFSDLMGNITGSGSETIKIEVGYTDPLLPICHWPAVTSHYLLPQNGGTDITVVIAAQAGSAMPDLSAPPLSATQSAAQLVKKYEQIYFQLAQPDLTVSVTCTLLPDTQVVISGARTDLMNFAVGYYLYAQAVSQLHSVKPCTSKTHSFAQLVAKYGLNTDQFALCNANQLAKDVLGTSAAIPIPAYATFAENDTAEAIVSDWPTISVTAQQLLENNSTLPLRPGIALIIPSAQITAEENVTLQKLADENHTSPGLLAEDNKTTPKVLQEGFIFNMDGQSVTVGKTHNSTFADVQKTFASLGIHAQVADIAVANETQPGMFVKNAALTNCHYLATDADTLAANESGVSLTDLATNNVGTMNIFDRGAAVYIGPYPSPPTLDSTDTFTLQQFCEQYGCTPALLFAYLEGEDSYSFPLGSTLEVPGMLEFQDIPGPLPSPPYATVITTLLQSSEAFAAANRAIRGLIAPAVTLTINDKTVITGTDDTWNTIFARFTAQGIDVGIAEVLAAIPADTNLYNTNATALLPPGEVALQADIGDGSGPFTPPVFPLKVSLRLQRPEALVATEFQTTSNDGPVERGESLIPAPIDPHHQSDGTSKGLVAFANQFNAAFPQLWLATGRIGDTDSDLWVVPFNASGITSISVAPGVTVPSSSKSMPRCFALRPLYNHLLNRMGLMLQTVKSDGNMEAGTKSTDIVNIDVEVWARRFLADLDLILRPPYSTGIHANASSALTTLLNAKNALISGIAEGLAPILNITDPNMPDGLTAAKDTLKNDLGISLSKAYATAAVVQYDAAVVSTFTSARLEGIPSAGEDSSRGYTFTSAKTDLSQASSFVSFLMSVDNPGLVSEVEIKKLGYQYTHLEYDIQPISTGSNTYDSSNWLTFVPPLPANGIPPNINTELGTARIPIPLRSYPTMPIITGQSSKQTKTTLTLENATKWTFGVSYKHEHTAQDEITVEARFNINSAGATWDVENKPHLTTALAQYIYVADTLWEMMAYFDDPSKGDATTAANAATSISTLINSVATEWESYWSVGQIHTHEAVIKQISSVPHSAKFNIRMDYSESGEEIQSIVLNKATSAFWGPVDGILPYVTYIAPGIPPIRIAPPTPSNNTLTYTLPANTPSAAETEITLEWEDLDLSSLQNGQAALSVSRNQDLMGDPSIATTESFVFQTRQVKAPSIATPLNEWSDSLNISSLGGTAKEALVSLFNALFKSNTSGVNVTIGLFYGFEIASSEKTNKELMTYLPVALYPNLTLSPPYSQTVQDIASELDTWKSNNCPNQPNGKWVFSLSLYSGIGLEAKRPLMTLEHIIYNINGT